jgi:hypothetical protein
VQKDERSGLQPRSQKCIYLGFENGYKGWRCLDLVTKCTIISHDVIFDETEFPGLSIKSSAQNSVRPVPVLIPNEISALPSIPPELDLPEFHHENQPHPIIDPPDLPDPEPDLPAPAPAPDVAPDVAPLPIPPVQPHRSSRATTRPNYRYFHDPFLRHDNPGPEGGAAANASIFQALEFIYKELDNTGANLISPDTIEMTFNATVKDDRVPKMFAEAM